MKWKVKLLPPPPKKGDTRTIRVFLWLPRIIGNEGRWLTWAEIKQECMDALGGRRWVDKGWANRVGVVMLSCKCGWTGTDPEYIAGQGACPDCGTLFDAVYSQEWLDGYRAWHNGFPCPDGEDAACGWSAAEGDYR